MRRFANAEIILGFWLGVLSLLFVVAVTSYQADHCAQEKPGSEATPKPNRQSAQQEPSQAKSEDQEREEEITEYAKQHPRVCGVLGFPRMTAYLMDHHEGFFVGFFTLALFAATFFLWRSTEKLWAAGEDQRALLEKTSERQLRAYIGFSGIEVTVACEDQFLTGLVKFKNFGATPAMQLTTRIWFGPAPLELIEQHLEFQNDGLFARVVMPSASTEVPLKTKSILTRPVVAIINEGLAITLIVARISYEDVFGQPRVTNIRMYREKSEAFFKVAQTGNDAT